MARPTTCPEPGLLRDLLDGRLSEDEQAELVGHLDSCADCQQALEGLATGGAPVAVAGIAVTQPPSGSAFWPALRKVEEGNTRPDVSQPPLAPRHPPLGFLGPPEGPEYLGRLGHFHVIEEVGRGGMGVVLRAFDPCLQRQVALKVLDPELASDELSHKRFCREARAAAAITHENVVAIHQVDEQEGSELPYLVMQFVSGESLEQRLERTGPLPLRDILRIGAQTATGLAAAHAQGLVHRDIKPANILLENVLDRVRITDFGLARAMEDVKLTQTGFVAGTPLYMAPEQARGEAVDHRTDLFSLGSVLYAMCTGQPPFTGSTPYAVLRHVTDDPPPPIQKANPAIPDWLVEVVDRLLAKKPADRYQSAEEVAELLSTRLAQLPATTPSGRHRRTSRWPARRRSAALWFLAGVLVGGLAMALALAVGPRLRNPTAPADGNSPAHLMTLTANVGPIWSAAFAPDGETLALGIDDGTVKVWNTRAGRVRATLEAHAGPVWSVALTADGSLLATGSDDGTVKLWSTADYKPAKVLPHEVSVRALAFSPNGKSLLTGGRNGKATIWDVGTGKASVTIEGHKGSIVAVAFSADGRTVATASGDKTAKLWDAASGQEQVALQGHKGGVYAVAFAPDGKTVATGSWDHTVRLWDVATGSERAVLRGHAQDVWSVAFSPDGKVLASASEDRTVKVWDAEGGKELATFRGHTGTLYTVAFSPDGARIASGGRDGTVRLWDALMGKGR